MVSCPPDELDSFAQTALTNVLMSRFASFYDFKPASLACSSTIDVSQFPNRSSLSFLLDPV